MSTLALCPHCGIDFERRAPVHVGDLTVELDGDASWKGERLPLNRSEREIVHTIARADGRTVTHEALINIIGADSINEDRLVWVHVCRVRAAFRRIDPSFDRIETVWSCGYRWRGE